MGGASNEKKFPLNLAEILPINFHHMLMKLYPIFIDSSMKLFHITQSLLVRSSTQEIASLVTPDMRIRWHDLQHC